MYGRRVGAQVEVAQGAREEVRTAEVIATLCLATDLGMGFPFEHGLEGTVVAMRLADELGITGEDASQTYYAMLLTHSGCTTDAQLAAEIFGSDLRESFHPVLYGSPRQVVFGLIGSIPDPDASLPARALQTARGFPKLARNQRPHLTATCEVGEMLAARLGLSPATAGLFAFLTERWDGKGPLRRAGAEEVPLPIRVMHVARDAVFQGRRGGPEFVAEVIGERAGGAFDPEIANCLASKAPELLAIDPDRSTWEEVLAAEPAPAATLVGPEIDRALAAFGDFADLISPHLTGHSARVAELAADAAARLGLDAGEVEGVRRAGHLHDIGRVGVHPAIWSKPGPLTADEWEQVRLHPYHTERVLSRSPFFAGLAPIASADHERLDGSGYHRGASAPALAPGARLLAAADAYVAMTSPRPHRLALSTERAADELAAEASSGRLDPEAAMAVLEQAGEPVPPIERPAGLTEREVQVLALLARGLQTKQVARALEISVKTADRHVQNAYAKVGVSTRAAATLYAMEHGLVAWGEFPIEAAPPRA